MKALVINGSPVKDGATSEITKIIAKRIEDYFDTKIICIDDYEIKYCKGCKICYTSACCIQDDEFSDLIEEMKKADVIITVAPSYWADIPGQLKSFIDRCTPYCNTHEPHATIGCNKKGYVVALRTGSNPSECHRIIETIKHFYGHMEIETLGDLLMCGIIYKSSINEYIKQLNGFCAVVCNTN